MTLTKEIFRSQALKNMKQQNSFGKLYRKKMLERRLLTLLQDTKNKNILFYYPLPIEADVTGVMQKMRKKSNIFLPFMVGKSFKMVPFRLPLKKKRFGIFEAGNTLRNIKKIDIAIVPSVGVDGELKRIGFGKGMYDRFFAQLKQKPYVIFVQPQLYYTHQRLCDTYDVQADVLVTPFKQITKHKAYLKG